MLLPGQAHRHPIDGEVDVAHDGAFFDLGPLGAGRAGNLTHDLFDHEFDIGTSTHVGEDPDVFETHHRGEDLVRVDKDGGASGTLAHTTTLKHLRLIQGDLRTRWLPAEIRRAAKLAHL